MSNNHKARRASHNHKLRIINLSYNSNNSLSSSLKNNNAKHTHIQKIKNHNKSYLALKTKALIQTCCNHIAKIKKNTHVIMKISMNCIMNFDLIFFNNTFQVISFVCSLFFIDLVHHFKFVSIYRRSTTTNINNINSFHIQKSVQNLPSQPSLNVTNVCRKNCNINHITKILHNKRIRSFKDFELMFCHREESFFIMQYEKT